MSEKIYRVQMNSKGMPNFSTAVEIADIPQGEWVVTQENGTHNYIYRCSVCEWYEYHAYPDVKGHNYCPNCGAKMKGA